MKSLILAALIVIAPATTAIAADDGTLYYVLGYTPGENWVADTAYEEQPGVEAHLEYLNKLFEDRRLLMGGRFTDAAMGLMILRADSLTEAHQVAANDPGVTGGILKVTVNSWDVRLSSIRWTERRPPPLAQDPDKSFRLQRIDPSAPIKLDKRD